ncbi:Lipid-A-disaccharide synthase,lipid-A-disaccharide synthase,Predicted membrane protein,lipid-A-disaccharide synthase,Lipid-A-disaccharide synthetase [Chlamydia serpentis]|uniref:Lipid-A-disaccharide synthase n=1 Tax=Chlamydia serpentis TaxID=1967782 RepID=A0A2R8FCK7_9CHLA|nr:lipid-A-disaccharide synthase [Chlamydia serpentis]SPN74072.1 Lipid-A-disaccharide synthase,lipid-A-disaccharide synthase,Predicted membrane protein,lipid-A-disaccharide synthase,Lipid-A-disaccharide synthetase [Chlamydia serpentis]
MIPSDLVYLLYPLGFFANLFFGSAFLVQWWLSEKRKQTYAPRNFWVLSSLGAILMIIHGIIQSQFPVTVLHVVNLVIYFRNLNINSSHRLSFQTTLILMASSVFLVTLPFLYINIEWMASPDIFHFRLPPAQLRWHLIGCLGLLIFSGRFLFQWFHIEFTNSKDFPLIFWKIGLLGGFLALIYFIRIGDPINILSYGCGLFPSIANLRLFYKERRSRPYVNTHCFLSAGEASGDILGSKLIQSIKFLYPNMTFSGVGGPSMRQEDFQPLLHTEEFQVSGFVEILGSLFKLFRNYRKILKNILQQKPATLIFIDFPDFHFFLIKRLRKRGYRGKIVHYVCPSIWAWRPTRKRTLEKYLDTLLLILPFEKDLFNNTSLETIYLGHPLVEEISNYKELMSWKETFLISDRPIIAAFPGSRRGDIARNLQVQIQAFLSSSVSQTHQLVVSSSNPEYDTIIREMLQKEGCKRSQVVPANLRYELMRSCDCALAKCGTIVLEAALNQTPTIVTCQLRPLDTFIAKYIFKILLPAYSLPNIIMDSIIFPEFIGGKKDFHPEEIAIALDLLSQGETKEKQKEACRKLSEVMMRGKTASQDFVKQIFDTVPNLKPEGLCIM